jgi:uncharacterized protein YyaL (SSP411 family)
MHAPYAHAAMLDAVEEQLTPPALVIIRCNDDQRGEWRQELEAEYAPARLVLYIGNDVEVRHTALRDKAPAAEQAQAYVCTSLACLPPVSSATQLRESLQ